MKALKISLLVVLVALVAVPLATAQTSGPWDCSFTVVNLGTAEAVVSVAFYNEAGAEFFPNPLGQISPGVPLTNPFTLAAGASQIVYVPAIPTSALPDGRYSAVISADQPIAAITNLTNSIGGTAPYFNGSYGGMEDVGQTNMYMPSVNRTFWGWNSHLSIQNLTGAQMTIHASFYSGSPARIHHVQQDVKAYSSWHLDVGAEAALPNGWNGSAVVTATGPIAVVDNATIDVQVVPSNPKGSTIDYSGIVEGDTLLYCPALYDRFFGWISSLNVQNIGTIPTTVTVAYSDGTVDTATVNPSAAKLWVYMSGAHATTFSAEVSSSATDIVAIVNAANPDGQALTYNCFLSTEASNTYFTPLTMKWFWGWNTGVQIMNVEGVTGTVTITYEGHEGTPTSVPVGPHKTFIFYTPGESYLPGTYCSPSTGGYSGAARITSTTKIVAVVNQSREAYRAVSCPHNPNVLGDWSMGFNAFGQ